MKQRSLPTLLLSLSLLFAFILQHTTVKAQSCSGTVSNGQNLVTNGDFSQGYSGWTYTADPSQTNGYLAFNPPTTANFSTPGMINVGTNPHVFNNAFSSTMTAPSGSGNMLMVDGICVPGINLWSQSGIPITPNTNYYFSVSIASMDNLAPFGTLAFEINGTTLPTTITASGNPGQWVRYTAVWNSGLTPPSTVTISIQNTTTTGCNNGVDFAIDNITLTPGCDFGSPGPLPNLGANFSICGQNLPLAINPGFNAATAAAANITYRWYVNGVLQAASSGMGSSFYSFNISGPGTYSVCTDSAGSCPKTSILTVTNNYSINLGPNVTLCNPTTDLLTAGYTGPGVTYQWSKGGSPISGGTNETYLVSTPGTYSVLVTDPVCGTQSSSVSIATNAAIPNDSSFCPVSSGGTGLTQLSVTGPGKYKWFTAASGGTVVATGSTYTPPPLTAPGPYTYYVQDTSTFNVTAGPPASSAGSTFTNPQGISGGSNQSLLVFNALTSFTINTITVLPYNYYCPSPATGNANVVNIIIKDASGNTVGTSTYSGQCTGAGQPAAAMIVPVNITVPQGNGYQMMLNTGSTNIALYQNTSMSYPTTYGGVLQVVSNNTSVFNQYYDPTAYPGYFDWNITHGINCQRVPVTATLNCPKCTLSTPPTSANVDFATYCTATTTQITLSASGGAGDSLVWYTGSCGGTKVASTNGIPVVIPAPTVTTTYYARWETKTGCVSTCVSVLVTPSTPPDLSVAGSNQTICNNNSTTLNANTPVNGTGAWTVISGSGSITNPASPQSTVTNLVTGDLILQWTISNSPCAASSSQVTLHRDSLVSPGSALANSATFCTATTTNITLSVAGGSSDSLIWYSGYCGSVKVGGNNTGAPLIITAPSTATSYFARWQSNSGCISQCASVLVTPVLPPDVSAAGTHQNICNSNSVTLSANTPVNGTGAWSVISGTGTITNPASAQSAVTGLVTGNLILQWTISNSPCAASSSQVTIHRDSLISPVASVDFATYCTATTTNITLSATGGGSDSLIWYSGSCGTIRVGGNNTGAPLIIAAPTATTTYFARWQSDSGCISKCGSIQVTPSLPPDPSQAGPNQQLCNNTSTALAANAPLVGTGVWSIISGNGTVTNLNNASSQVTGLSIGADLVLQWTISSGICPNTSSQVTIHMDTLTKVPVITGLSFDTCASTGGLVYGVQTDHSPASVYSWVVSGDVAISSQNQNSVTVNSGLQGGSIQLTETNGACSLSSMKTIGIQGSVVTPVLGGNITICSNDYFLHTPIPTSGYGKWSMTGGSGVFTNIADTLFHITGLTNGVNTFTWTVTGCGGTVSSSINITVKTSTMVAKINAPKDTLCINTPRPLNVSITGGTGNYSYVWWNSTNRMQPAPSSANGMTIQTQLPSITYYVYAIDNLNQGCNSTIDSATIYSVINQNLTFTNLIIANDDGLNDYFIAREPLDNGGYKDPLPGTRVEIYNRWGSQVYHSDNYDNSFKGKNLADDVYYYSVRSGCGGDTYKGWLQIMNK